MNFLKSLFSWFFFGRKPDQNVAPVEDPIAQAPEDPVEDTRRPSEKILDDIFQSTSSEDILREMKSLERVSQRFESARQELIKELRNITPRRGMHH